jgi:hypothetical protein
MPREPRGRFPERRAVLLEQFRQPLHLLPPLGAQRHHRRSPATRAQLREQAALAPLRLPEPAVAARLAQAGALRVPRRAVPEVPAVARDQERAVAEHREVPVPEVGLAAAELAADRPDRKTEFLAS